MPHLVEETFRKVSSSGAKLMTHAVGLHMPSVYPKLLIASTESTQPFSDSPKVTQGLLTMARKPLTNILAIFMAYDTKPQIPILAR